MKHSASIGFLSFKLLKHQPFRPRILTYSIFILYLILATTNWAFIGDERLFLKTFILFLRIEGTLTRTWTVKGTLMEM